MVSNAKFKDEDALGYRVDIVGRNVQITEPIRVHIWEKLSKIERFHNHILHLHVTLEIQKLEHICTLLLKIEHTQVKCRADSTDMYVSIDKALDRMKVLLARYKSRIQDHHKRNPSIIDVPVNVLYRPASEVDEFNVEIAVEAVEDQVKAYLPHKIIGTETRSLKMLLLDEAVMKMDLSGDQFLVFRSEEDQKLKVLYRRKDGNYGLIQPE